MVSPFSPAHRQAPGAAPAAASPNQGDRCDFETLRLASLTEPPLGYSPSEAACLPAPLLMAATLMEWHGTASGVRCASLEELTRCARDSSFFEPDEELTHLLSTIRRASASSGAAQAAAAGQRSGGVGGGLLLHPRRSGLLKVHQGGRHTGSSRGGSCRRPPVPWRQRPCEASAQATRRLLQSGVATDKCGAEPPPGGIRTASAPCDLALDVSKAMLPCSAVQRSSPQLQDPHGAGHSGRSHNSAIAPRQPQCHPRMHITERQLVAGGSVSNVVAAPQHGGGGRPRRSEVPQELHPGPSPFGAEWTQCPPLQMPPPPAWQAAAEDSKQRPISRCHSVAARQHDAAWHSSDRLLQAQLRHACHAMVWS